MNSTINRTVGIMTVYYPKNQNFENAKLIAEQVDLLIICDNSPMTHAKLFQGINNLRYYYFKKNMGLSSAFNYVLRDDTNNWNDSDYVCFFDQDTKIPQKHVLRLKNEYESLLAMGESVGGIGPQFYEVNARHKSNAHIKKEINKNTIRVKNIITSSMLCQYGILRKVNFWNMKVFLDWADFDICWRLIKNGFHVYMTKVSLVNHTLGESCKKIGPFSITVDKPFREYYQIRDSIGLIMKSYTPINYKIRFIFMFASRPITHCLLLDHGINRIFYIFKAIKDFILGYHGELKTN